MAGFPHVCVDVIESYGVRVAHDRVCSKCEVVLAGPREAKVYEVEPEKTDGGGGGADAPAAAAGLRPVQLQHGLPLGGLGPATRHYDAANAEAAGAGPARPARPLPALRRGVTSPVTSRARASCVGEPDHGEDTGQAENRGEQGEQGEQGEEGEEGES